MQLPPGFKKLLNYKNYSQQHGWLVVEFMARDGGHLPEPRVGNRVTLVGAWVLDSEHGWNEIHPVWRLVLNGNLYKSGPQYGGSPALSRSKNAEAACRDQNGHSCLGYHHKVPQRRHRGSTARAGATAKCRDGSYSYSHHRRGTCSYHGGVAVWLRSVPS